MAKSKKFKPVAMAVRREWQRLNRKSWNKNPNRPVRREK